MGSIDLIAMLANIGQSLLSVQRLLGWMSYLIGILFILNGVWKLRGLSHSREHSSSKDKMFGPTSYFLFGGFLLFIPSSLRVFSSSLFGKGNILQYTPSTSHDIFNSMAVLIQTAGIIWFMRGCVLLAHSSESGQDEGRKGFAFLSAGLLAINFQDTMSTVAYLLGKLLAFTGMGGGSSP